MGTTQTFSNSSLVEYTRISPNCNSPRNHDIDRITPHCVVGQLSVQSLGEIFAKSSRQASSNYGIGYDGKVALYCEEKNRSWCSSSPSNDHRTVTIECASDKKSPYAFTTVVFDKLVELCTDICKRYNKKKLIWISDKATALAYQPKSDEMLLTVHKWFADTICPGDWMMSRMSELAQKVTAKLQAPDPSTKTTVIYYVQVGAYSVKSNSEACLKKAKAAGFTDAYIKKENGYYKVQLGAYRILDNAKKQQQAAIKAGFKDAYIVKGYKSL